MVSWFTLDFGEPSGCEEFSCRGAALTMESQTIRSLLVIWRLWCPSGEWSLI